MVTFYKGNTLSGVTTRILDALDPSKGGRHVVLVPDRNTLSREEAVLKALGGSMVNVEVLTFARFAVRVLGPEVGQCLTPEACTLLLAKALLRCKDSLRYYRRAVDTEGFANEMYSSLVAVRNSGISPDDLDRAADRMQGRSADKTHDMAAIYRAYLGVLGDLVDPTSRLERLARAISDSDYVASCHIYVIDFYAFNHVQYAVLGALMRHAASLHIGYIAPDVGGDNRRIFPHDLRDTLLDLSKQAGVFCSTVLAYSPLPLYRSCMQDALFGFSASAAEPRAIEEAQQHIHLFACDNLAEEMRSVCAEIRSLLRLGYRYRDIALVCADPEVYWDVMHNVFAEYDIPLFADRQAPLSGEPVARFLVDILECVRLGCDYDAVMRVVKNPLFSMDVSAVHAFENYCLDHGIRYTLFLHPFTLGEVDERAQPEEVRAAFQSLLPDLGNCRTVADYVAALRDMFEQIGLNDRFLSFYSNQRHFDFVYAAAVSRQVPEKMMCIMDMLVRLVGEEQGDLLFFMRLFRSALASVSIRLLPQSADCVYIGDAASSRYEGVKVMFVLGAEEGNLPADPALGSILSEAFYRTLSSQNIQIRPTNKEQWLASRFYLEQLLLLPEDALYVSYADRGEDDKPRSPSSLVGTLVDLFELPVTRGLGHDLACQIGVGSNMYKVLLRLGDRLTPADRERLVAALPPTDRPLFDAVQNTPSLLGADRLFFKRDLTSISQLESYFACPYHHFVRYGLRATERKSAEADAAETGTMLHRVMELFFSRYTSCLDDMDAAAFNLAVDECVDIAFAESRFANEGKDSTPYRRLLRESRIVLDLEVRLVRQSLFKPAFFEVEFGRGSFKPIDLGRVKLRGKIDRIDLCGKLADVIDYKTGTGDCSFSYIYYGRKVQLYAYMAALKQAGYIPAGGFYKRLSGALRRDGDKYPIGCLVGQLPLDKPEWLRLFDPALFDRGSSDLIPVTIKKGEPSASNQVGITYAQMEQVMDYVDRLMRGAVDEILQGNVQASPLGPTCGYCPAYAICPKGRATPGREMKTIGIDSFAPSDSPEEMAEDVPDNTATGGECLC